MANRHKHHHHKARGGSEMGHRDDYAGSGEPNVVKEAKEKKSGGAVMKNVGGAVPGKKAGGRISKNRGGGVGGGSDKHPFSSAHHGSKAG